MQLSNEDSPPSTLSECPSILFQFSKRCRVKEPVLEAPHFARLRRFGHADTSLGQFLRDTLFDTIRPCDHCGEPGYAHVYRYIYLLGSLTIKVEKDPDNWLAGEENGRIWTWHHCLSCLPENGVPPASPKSIMSDAALGLSFGEFLELIFSTHAAANRMAACGHSLYRDCLLFYGCGSLVACFEYSHITLHSFYRPPLQLQFNCPMQQDWLQKEVTEVVALADLVLGEVANKLGTLGGKIASATQHGSCTAVTAKQKILALEELLQNEKAVFKEELSRAAPPINEPGRALADILKLNGLRRHLLINSARWDCRLQFLESNCFPPQKHGTGSVDNASILSKEKLNDGDDNMKLSENLKAEKDSSSLIVSSSHAKLISGRSVESDPLKQAFIEDKASEMQFSGSEKHEASENVESIHNPLDPSELGGRTGLDFQLQTDDLSTLVKVRLNGIDLTRESHISASSSEIANSSSVPKAPTSPLKRNGEPGSTEASSGEDNSALLERHGAGIGVISTDLYSDATPIRSLSEGKYPILADLSEIIEAAWTGDEGTVVDAPSVDEIAKKVNDSLQVHEKDHDPDLKVPDSDVPFVDQSSLKVGVQQGDLSSLDKLLTSTAPVSVSDPLVKLDNSEDFFEGWKRSPFGFLFKSFHHINSIKAANEDGKVPTSGLSFIFPRAAQRAADGGARIFLPLARDDVVVAVYDNEPTTMIAYALSTEEHHVHVTAIPLEKENIKVQFYQNHSDHLIQGQALESHPLQSSDVVGEDVGGVTENSGSPNEKSKARIEADIQNPLISTKASQMVKKTISFRDHTSEEKVHFEVTCYFPEQFDALRKECCNGNTEYIRSLCRCKKWGAKGGKSNVFFAKTVDDRFVVKQVTRTELNSFLDFASSYFTYLFNALSSGNQTCLAKVFGVYELKTTEGGKETKLDLLVMENLFYGRNVTRIYDLKGSMRSRFNADADTDTGKVLLDQNLIEEMPAHLTFVRNNAKRHMERAIWNDTHFLSLVLVMDYSLLVGVDQDRKQLVVGIIDFFRQYTWDKHLETWVKASGLLGGPRNAQPTIISPEQYKKRFRKTLPRYFVMVPDEWLLSAQIEGPEIDDNTFKDDSIKEED